MKIPKLTGFLFILIILIFLFSALIEFLRGGGINGFLILIPISLIYLNFIYLAFKEKVTFGRHTLPPTSSILFGIIFIIIAIEMNSSENFWAHPSLRSIIISCWSIASILAIVSGIIYWFFLIKSKKNFKLTEEYTKSKSELEILDAMEKTKKHLKEFELNYNISESDKGKEFKTKLREMPDTKRLEFKSLKNIMKHLRKELYLEHHSKSKFTKETDFETERTLKIESERISNIKNRIFKKIDELESQYHKAVDDQTRKNLRNEIKILNSELKLLTEKQDKLYKSKNL